MPDLLPSSPANESAQLRKWVYALLITVALGAAAGRILNTERVYEPTMYRNPKDSADTRGNWPSTRPAVTPSFSFNVRSSCSTVRSLVDHHTFVIGERDRALLEPSAISLLAANNCLDASLLAEAGYRLRTTKNRSIWNADPKEWPGFESGWDSVDKVLDPQTFKFYSTKPPLLSVLVAGLYWLLQQITGWTLADNVWQVVRTILLLVNVLPFGVYLGLMSKLVERYCQNNWTRLYIMAAAAFATLVTPFLITLNNHTVATFCVVFALFPALKILAPVETEPKKPRPILFLTAGLFSAFVFCNELPGAAFTALLGLLLVCRYPLQTLLYFLPGILLPLAAFFLTNYWATGEWWLAYDKFGTIWYEYEGSHWAKPIALQNGIDFASEKYGEQHWQYIAHVLIGHHGWFSLTPIWLLALVGMVMGIVQKKDLPRLYFASSLLLSAVVIGFYLFVVGSRNYGGFSAGLRWLMWLTPLWLLSLIPALDALARYRWGRRLAYVLLALSVLSASYPAWNPWRHPWLMRWMQDQGWILY
jgi:hypothetical protein